MTKTVKIAANPKKSVCNLSKTDVDSRKINIFIYHLQTVSMQGQQKIFNPTIQRILSPMKAENPIRESKTNDLCCKSDPRLGI